MSTIRTSGMPQESGRKNGRKAKQRKELNTKARDVRGGENNPAVHAVDQTPIIVNLGGISIYLGHFFSP